MRVLVINGGSSSLKAAVVDSDTGARGAEVLVERIGGDCVATVGTGAPASLDVTDHESALAAVLPELVGDLGVDAVGHRVVHGGDRFSRPTVVDDDVVAAVEALVPLAPLHNPANLEGIRAARRLLPEVPHVAVFDTAFHATLPRRAYTYAIPTELTERLGLRRYGFHGTSHGFVAARAARFLGEDLGQLRVVVCHLGNGASVTAVEYGRSVDTSMGLTPLEGLVMGTRSGDVDPGLVIALLRDEGMSVDDVDRLLNRESGLAGLSGVGNDLRDIEAAAEAGDDRCRVAIGVFCHRLRKYIGAYAAVMGGLDAVVFTGGIGEHSASVRLRVTQRLEFLGARVDLDANRTVALTADAPVAVFSAPHSRVRLLAVRTDEERAIAEQTAGVVGHAVARLDAPIPIAVSARHVHLTKEHVAVVFGPGHTLTPKAPLSQPGQFACEDRVTLVGPRGQIERVRLIGPERSRSQVEISRTDEFKLGIDAPVRASGHVQGTPGVTVVGPAGTLHLDEGLICAKRHVHMTTVDAAQFGVSHGDIVEVAVDTDGRDLVFGDVTVRVKDSYRLEMHIDTDEANAAEIGRGATGVLFDTGRTARIRARAHAPGQGRGGEVS